MKLNEGTGYENHDIIVEIAIDTQGQYPHTVSHSVLRRELRRGVICAISKQLELWLSTHELAVSQREPA